MCTATDWIQATSGALTFIVACAALGQWVKQLHAQDAIAWRDKTLAAASQWFIETNIAYQSWAKIPDVDERNRKKLECIQAISKCWIPLNTVYLWCAAADGAQWKQLHAQLEQMRKFLEDLNNSVNSNNIKDYDGNLSMTGQLVHNTAAAARDLIPLRRRCLKWLWLRRNK